MPVDLAIRKTLSAGGRTFTLDVRLASAARRIAVVGPSGGGKSLTLKAVAGLIRPDEGHIRVNGVTWFDAQQRIDLPPRLRRGGYLFQDYALFPHLNVRQNIAFGLDGGGRWFNPRARVHGDALDYWLGAFDLEALGSLFPHQLSGGQRQRVALARTLVVQPHILLLDEPFAAVDALLRERMREELNRLQRELDIPMILITHDPLDAEVLADEVFHLLDGAITGSGEGWNAPGQSARGQCIDLPAHGGQPGNRLP